ncbi:MAG: 16S rRNA (cytosine(1402)-N(4))-methyltransferase RsmH [Candidatus Buchananbacteria bacterium]|nr:16S rRNA (cytosine(1402)-N(4))-methyltransferase RsmH [Candidatus Buchananbacteria bacterium]
MPIHEPVLLDEILEGLNPQPNQNFIDGTYGAGGHSAALLERVAPNGRVIGIDRDPAAIAAATPHERLLLINENYRHLGAIIKQINHAGINQISGILLDLGLSSDQLSAGDRGFSFEGQATLDLRFNPEEQIPTARDLLAELPEADLTDLLRTYGDEPLARPIAQAIIKARRDSQVPETAEMLVQLVSGIYRRRYRAYSKRNPATKTFQALRIAVNQEFQGLEEFLPQAIEILPPGGRLAIISFHSGEDRIVKHYFKDQGKQGRVRVLTKRPLIASDAERERNPRSRSAKLRLIEKI